MLENTECQARPDSPQAYSRSAPQLPPTLELLFTEQPKSRPGTQFLDSSSYRNSSNEWPGTSSFTRDWPETIPPFAPPPKLLRPRPRELSLHILHIGPSLEVKMASTDRVTDDELKPEETAGFKVGEKKTIEEYHQLGKCRSTTCFYLSRCSILSHL